MKLIIFVMLLALAMPCDHEACEDGEEPTASDRCDTLPELISPYIYIGEGAMPAGPDN